MRPLLLIENYLPINATIERLEGIDPDLASFGELRFFGGLYRVTAEALSVSEATAKAIRDPRLRATPAVQ